MKNFIKKVLEFLNIPKHVYNWYAKRCFKYSKQMLKKACRTLDEYARETLDVAVIKKENFEEVKFMYLEYASNRINLKSIIGVMVECLCSFFVTVILCYFSKESIIQGYMQSSIAFASLFFVVFYIPRKIKIWYYDKTHSTKNIDKLTYDLYVKYREGGTYYNP